jgi:hypothetical protein
MGFYPQSAVERTMKMQEVICERWPSARSTDLESGPSGTRAARGIDAGYCSERH